MILPKQMERQMEITTSMIDLSAIIKRLEEENERLRKQRDILFTDLCRVHQENESYKLWMDRSITRIKGMQNYE